MRLLLVAVAAVVGMKAQSAQVITPDFTRDVQPIFAKSCNGCHGAKMQSANLRLDSKQSAARVIEPGKADRSLLYSRILGHGDQPRMPLGGKALPPDQVATLKQWIDSGANWPDEASAKLDPAKKHWAFIPPVRPAVPTTQNPSWVRTPIDAFVLARLEKENLTPSPEAAKTTLLRRLSLDIIGLPPTVDELNAYLADKSPNAYEKQVDRLLASPHYGERFARTWLDAARYADSDGFEKDKAREAWFYRDWVINSLNRDLPYNQFVIEQIAGDLLPNPTQDQIVATGFLRNSLINEEGGADPAQFRMEAMFDRMEAVGKGILGVTIQCAQCHNHKFDPLKQEEYYRMFAFLNTAVEARAAVYTPADQMKRADILQRTHDLEMDLQHRYPEWPQRMAAWEKQVTAKQPKWTVLDKLAYDDISAGGEKFFTKPDGSLFGEGFIATGQKLKLTGKTSLPRITAIRLELMTDPELPFSGPGRGPDGMCALSELQLSANGSEVKFAKATADFGMPITPIAKPYNDPKKLTDPNRIFGPVDFAIDGKPETAWGIDMGPGVRNQGHNAVFTLGVPIDHEAGSELTITLAQQHSGTADSPYNTNLGRFRLSITDDPNAAADPLPDAVRAILTIPADQRTPSQLQTVFRYWRTTVPEFQSVDSQIASLWKNFPEAYSQLVLQPMATPRETHLLTRGNFLNPAEVVQPGVPSFLNPLPKDAPPTRLTFAKWLVARDSPTTARSIVNRVWQNYFGIGLVSTAENFGTQAETPSNPELLDWLAVEFMDGGWSLKKLQRMIVTSSAYRQASSFTPESLAKDPENRLISRGARFRVDAEIVRDIALSSSGLLNAKVGGASVFPPAPAFLFLPPTSYSPKSWVESQGPDRYRRALYTFRYRSSPYPVLQAFDAPNGDFSCVRRDRSNTPLQALATLNETVFMEAAHALAENILDHGFKTDQERIRYGYRRVLGREPEGKETAVLLKLLAGQTTPINAWTTVSRVLLNLDETITKE